jgi:hypothetical protein
MKTIKIIQAVVCTAVVVYPILMAIIHGIPN